MLKRKYHCRRHHNHPRYHHDVFAVSSAVLALGGRASNTPHAINSLSASFHNDCKISRWAYAHTHPEKKCV